MVVDDEEDTRSLLQMTLEPEYEVFSATNGLDAMFKLTRYEPDLAVIDIMMPLMNGLDLAAKIRRTPGYQDLPIVALSALNSKDDMKKGYDAGVDVYLTKPFQPDRAIKNVAFSLQNRAVRPKNLTARQIVEREESLAAKTRRAVERHKVTEAVESASSDAVPKPGIGRAHPVPARREPTPATVADTPEPWGAVEHPRRRKPAEAAAEPRPRIMLVDDDADYLDIQRQVLEERYEVVTAVDGMDALNKIPDVQPDLFVIDGMMPRMSGYQLVDMIRGTMETRGTPIVFASAKGSERDKKMMAGKGVPHYLVKPFEPSEMIRTIEAIVSAPGFEVQKKKQRLEDFLYEEGKRRAEVMSHTDKKKRWETYGALEGFLKQNRGKGAFDRD